ncbi:MAG: GTPase HflX [Pseudomonadota bacterium]
MKQYRTQIQRKADRVLVVGIGRPGLTRQQMMLSLEELVDLVHTAGGQVVGSTYQDLKRIDPATFIGKGKVQDIAALVQETQADLVVLDEEISPIQNRNLEDQLKVYVLDRTAVILDIFAMRARTSEGQLQVELAQLEYLAPRLVGRGKMLSQQTGGIGTRGPGETQLEYDRRRIRDRITHLKRDIERVRGSREIYRAKRQAVPIPLVAIVGYTNAGKSTLMNQLTKANLFVEDKLFATLDPTVRRLRLPSGREILLADTVGFIRRLPHQLVAAFKATFEEISFADLIVEIIDCADPDAPQQRQVVDEVLTEMRLNNKPHLIVLNKTDLPEKYMSSQEGISISALKAKGLELLIDKIDESLRQCFHRLKLKLPYAEGHILSTIYRIGHVFEAKHEDEYIYVDCELPDKYRQKYRKYQLSLRGA